MFEPLSNRRIAPINNSTIAVSAVSANTTIAGPGSVLELRNNGSAMVYWKVGLTAPTAVAGGVATAANTGSAPLLPGEILSVPCPPDGTIYVAAVCDAAATSVLRISRGG